MMIPQPTLRNCVISSVIFHLALVFLLCWNSSNSRAVLINESKNEPGQILPVANPLPKQPEIVKAVSVNSKEVNEAVNRLKVQREQAQQAEKIKQQQLAKQAEAARQQRIKEEQRVTQLKEEAEKIAIARKKQHEEEQKHLKELALQKEQEAKRLQDMRREQEALKQQQQLETKKLEAIKQKQLEEKKLAEKIKLEKQKADQEKAALAARQEAAARQAQLDAANQAHIAGEVDKYKALIIDAISRQWILPDNANRNLSSQFRIRLAPDGGVLEVSLIRSSGDPILDRSAQTAIYKASPLPVPTDTSMFNLFREISLTVRPENIRG